MLLFALFGVSTLSNAQDLNGYASSPISIVASSVVLPGIGETSGVNATSGEFNTGVFALDRAGNIYFSNGAGSVRMVYVGGPVPPLLQFALAYNVIYNGTNSSFSEPTSATVGDVYTIANIRNVACSPGGTCGDGDSAQAALLTMVTSLAFDSAENLYISDDMTYTVRKVSVSDGTISTVAGDPLYTNQTYNGNNIPAVGAFLGPAEIAFDSADNLFIADGYNNLIRRVDANTRMITTVAGDNTQPGVACSDNICGIGGLATSALFEFPTGLAISSSGDLFISDYLENAVFKVDHASGKINTIAGTIGTTCMDTMCGGDGVPATQATFNIPYSLALDASGDLIITDQGDNTIRGLLQDGTIRTLAGVISQTNSLGPQIGPAGLAQFSAPQNAVTDSVGNLYISANNVIWEVAAPIVLAAQTISFNQIPAAVYGNASINLDNYASVDSGLPLSFTCTGPVTCPVAGSSVLTLTGAGTVAVTASQAGDTTHLAATSVTITFQVAKAALTVQANDISFTYQSITTLPALTFSFKGFVPGDSAAGSVTGAPVLATSATPTSAVGQYPITLALGTLASANYSLTAANGTLTITGGAAQTITFASLPNVTYGVATFALNATASSGLPITYTVSGPASNLGSNLTVMGAGTVTVTANQAGDMDYGPATAVTQSFQVAPAMLTITPLPVTRAYNAPNPAFTFAATGFVSADTTSVLSGAPVFTTTATVTSPPGIYPLSIAQGTLFASNYTIVPGANSTVTVGLEPQTISFAPLPDIQIFGQLNLTAVATSGLSVAYAVTGPATLTGTQLAASGLGTITVTASQPGNSVFAAATPVTQSFTVSQQNDRVTATSFTIPFGAAIPTLSYGFTDAQLPANAYSGVPTLTTTATAGSPPGEYPIVITAGTLTAPFYNFQFVNGTLTILPPSSFILTATPPSIDIPRGQARQVTILLTPVNNFIGSVTIGCTGLPAGVTCVASPNTLTTTQGATGVQPVTGTLTISAGASVASAQNRAGESNLSVAGWFWLPSLLLGGWIAWQRKRVLPHRQAQRLLLIGLLLLGASSLIACGTSSGGSNSVQLGTTVIQVSGNGTSTGGPASASVALSVTIQ